MKSKSNLRQFNLRSSSLRNQHGLATWVKIILSIFALGLLVAIVGSICLVGFFKDMTDPKKTQEVANKIVTLAEPLPGPFEYGRMNISMFGYSGALINNSSTNALFFLIKSPRKDGEDNAQKTMDKVAKGEAGLPDTSGALPGSNTSAGAGKSNMNVESQGVLDCGGTKLYYVMGKSVAKRPSGDTANGAKPAEVETFLGGADGKDPHYGIFIMGQQLDPNKHLTMDEVNAFLFNIKAI
jgi:hypothetical protein